MVLVHYQGIQLQGSLSEGDNNVKTEFDYINFGDNAQEKN